MRRILFLLLSISGSFSFGQSNLSDYVKSYLALEDRKLAFVHAKVIDGKGQEIVHDQTILIEEGTIVSIGYTSLNEIPSDYKIIDLSGRTIIPGIVGTHNHMRLPQGAMLFTSTRLYLAAGVTTYQTCGTGNPAEEIAISNAIQNGEEPGSLIVNSGPYFTGPDGKSNFVRFSSEKAVRDTIAYWAGRGVEWFKVYRHTRPEDLKVIVEEAHKHGAKVTGHFCATTFEEAARIGVDAIEHGFIHSFDHAEDHQTGVCSGSRSFRSALDINSEEVGRIHQLLIREGVALSTTPSILEAQVASRAYADERTLNAMAPFHVEAYETRRKRMDEKGDDWYFKLEWLTKSLQYDRLFYQRGGLLTAGPDPGLHNLPGYGDQRNYQLLVEAGFKPQEAIQVMTSNGAELLELDHLGSIEIGKQADLVILNGDLENETDAIEKVGWVIKDGWVFDPEKLVADIHGHMGSSNDDYMTYLGRRSPGKVPELLAPHFISTDEHEFGSVFSKDGKEFFFGVEMEVGAEIRYSAMENGVWSPPKRLSDSITFTHNDPFLSSDEQRLYFIGKKENDYDIWYCKRMGNGWSAPINTGANINSAANEYYMSFTEDSSMYFSSNRETDNFDIYKSQLVDGHFQQPVKISERINTENYEADVFIAPDESYMIFCGIREEGAGRGDLYISFKDDAGNWGEATPFDGSINTEAHELCPFVTRDGKYFLFTRGGDIYWVSAEIIESYR